MYCPKCGNQTETGADFCHRCGIRLPGRFYPTQQASQPKRSGILTASAVLLLVSGGLGLVIGLLMVSCGSLIMNTDYSSDPYLYYNGFEDMIGAMYLTAGIMALPLSALSVFGGIKTLKRSSFGWAIAGSIGAMFASLWLGMIPGIIACIFIIMSIKEFYSRPSQPETPIEQNNVIH